MENEKKNISLKALCIQFLIDNAEIKIDLLSHQLEAEFYAKCGEQWQSKIKNVHSELGDVLEKLSEHSYYDDWFNQNCRLRHLNDDDILFHNLKHELTIWKWLEQTDRVNRVLIVDDKNHTMRFIDKTEYQIVPYKQ